MRLGQNPAKAMSYVAQPQRVTVAVTTYIPFLSGYYTHALEVLKVCLGSILAHSDLPYDLMVFDNASCQEVTTYLSRLKEAGQIQFLILSAKNLGKVGAWNHIFGAAPGEFVAYSDSDVFYYPGWLSQHLKIFEVFPEAITVAGLPRRGDLLLYTNTLNRLAQLPDIQLEKGRLIPDQWILDHARSLDKLAEVQPEMDLPDYRLTRGGVSAYATGTHFQFMVRTSLVRRWLPFSSNRPMGESLVAFDQAMNNPEFIRLSTLDRTTRHMGNNLDETMLAELPLAAELYSRSALLPSNHQPGRVRSNFYAIKPVKRLLLWLYNRIFRIYYG